MDDDGEKKAIGARRGEGGGGDGRRCAAHVLAADVQARTAPAPPQGACGHARTGASCEDVMGGGGRGCAAGVMRPSHRAKGRGVARLGACSAPGARSSSSSSGSRASRGETRGGVCVCVCVCEGGAGGAREAALWQRRHRGALGASLPFFVAVKRGATARPHAHLAARHAPHSIILNTPGWQCTREAFWTRVWGVLGVPRGAKPYWNVD